MEDNFNIFELLDDNFTTAPPECLAPEPELPIAPVLTDQEEADYRSGVLPLRSNYVRLGWHIGGLEHKQVVFSAKEACIYPREAVCLRRTEYVVAVPLPAAWLDNPETHLKAHLLEEKLLWETGFRVDMLTGKWDVANTTRAAYWKVENCLCPKCLWMKDQCHCKVVIEEEA